MHTFYCSDESGKFLKIGDDSRAVLAFVNGWAYLPTDHPEYEYLVRICNAERNYHIEDLGVDTERADPTAAGSNTCSICGNAFKSDFGMKSHMRSHAPKAPKE